MALTKEQMKLLLDDLCARLSYSVKGTVKTTDGNGQEITDDGIINSVFINEHGKAYICVDGAEYELEDVKPYLRSMSSMTDDEFGFLQEHLPYDFTRVYSGKFDLIDDIHLSNSVSIDDMAFLLDCLNKWHLDYRGLIPMGLALEAPEDMYKF